MTCLVFFVSFCFPFRSLHFCFSVLPFLLWTWRAPLLVFTSLSSNNTATLWLPLLAPLTFKHFIVANYVKYHILDLCLVFSLSVGLSNHQGDFVCGLTFLLSFSSRPLSVPFLCSVYPQTCSSSGNSVGVCFFFFVYCLLVIWSLWFVLSHAEDISHRWRFFLTFVVLLFFWRICGEIQI